MLDDLKYIHEKDVSDTLGVAEKQPIQLAQDYEIKGNRDFGNIDKIVYSGMGGSALAAYFINTWPRLNLPYEVVRDYSMPDYVDSSTLVIVSSYSGNTEETLSALEDAEQKGAQIAVITGGGKLLKIAEDKQYLLGISPKLPQPRYAVLANYRLLLDILSITEVLKVGYKKELEATAGFLSNSLKSWLPTVATKDNQAKQIALESIGKSIVIYGGPLMYPAAYKWKISYNENAKQIAWTGQYPEFNHNEFIGWSKQPVDKPYFVVDLMSNMEHERVTKRFETSSRLLSGLRPESYVVQSQGENALEQLLWAMVLGDFTTLYTGIANGLNPAPVDLVEKFKKEMNN